MATDAVISDLQLRVLQLEATLTQETKFRRLLEDEFQDHKSTVHVDIEKWAQDINAQVRRLEASGGPGGRGVQSVRKMKDPKPLDLDKGGKRPEQIFSNWSFEFSGHFERMFPNKGEAFLKWAAQHDGVLQGNDVAEQVREMELDPDTDNILYGELRKVCNDGTPQLILRRLNESKRGAEAWRLMCDQYDPRGPLIAQGIIERLNTMEWPKDSSEVRSTIETMDVLMKEYQDITKEEYPEVAKRGRLVAIMPKDYKKHINANAALYKTYDRVRDFVLEQTRLKREEDARENSVKPRKGDAHKEANALAKIRKEAQDEILAAMWTAWPDAGQEESSEEPDPYEALNALFKGKGKGKGGKGQGWSGKGAGSGSPGYGGYGGGQGYGKGGAKGTWQGGGKGNGWGGSAKGGGKGKGFPGNCHYCGQLGHRLNQCEKKTADMKKQRGANALDEEEEDEEEDEIALLCEECGQDGQEVNALSDGDVEMEYPGWEKHRTLMDSGSSSSFLKNGALPHVKVEPPTEKDRKRRWSTASGDEVRMSGSSRVKFVTNDGDKKAMQVKRSEKISKNITAVSEVCDRDQMCIFSKSFGVIIKDPQEKIAQYLLNSSEGAVRFERDKGKGTYSMDMWVQGGAARNGPARPERKEPAGRTPTQPERKGKELTGRKPTQPGRKGGGTQRMPTIAEEEPDDMEVDGLMALSAQDWQEVVSKGRKRKMAQEGRKVVGFMGQGAW